MREKLEEAFNAAFPKPRVEDEPKWQGPGTLREPLYHHWFMRAQRFTRLLDAEAWLDAALMLVPDGWVWSADNFDGPNGSCSAWVHDRKSAADVVDGYAPTPAEALLASIEKARTV